MDEDILKGNKMIALFMGGKDFMNSIRFGNHPSEELGVYYDYDKLLYHKSWNWIMPVCKKFDSITIGNEKYIWYCDRIDNAVTRYEILDVFRILVEAINWYNIEYGTKHTN